MATSRVFPAWSLARASPTADASSSSGRRNLRRPASFAPSSPASRRAVVASVSESNGDARADDPSPSDAPSARAQVGRRARGRAHPRRTHGGPPQAPERGRQVPHPRRQVRKVRKVRKVRPRVLPRRRHRSRARGVPRRRSLEPDDRRASAAARGGEPERRGRSRMNGGRADDPSPRIVRQRTPNARRRVVDPERGRQVRADAGEIARGSRTTPRAPSRIASSARANASNRRSRNSQDPSRTTPRAPRIASISRANASNRRSRNSKPPSPPPTPNAPTAERLAETLARERKERAEEDADASRAEERRAVRAQLDVMTDPANAAQTKGAGAGAKKSATATTTTVGFEPATDAPSASYSTAASSSSSDARGRAGGGDSRAREFQPKPSPETETHQTRGTARRTTSASMTNSAAVPAEDSTAVSLDDPLFEAARRTRDEDDVRGSSGTLADVPASDSSVLPKPIFVLSDCTGESAANTCRAARSRSSPNSESLRAHQPLHLPFSQRGWRRVQDLRASCRGRRVGGVHVIRRGHGDGGGDGV